MRQTLFTIPVDGPWSLGPLGEWPGFGFGIALALWVAFGAFWIYQNRQEPIFSTARLTNLATWLGIAVVIVYLPNLVAEFGGTNKTIRETTAALEANPDATEPRLARAEAWHKLRDDKQAVDDLESAVRADDRSAVAHNRLAYLLATSPDDSVRDGGRAVTHAKRACELTDENEPDYLDTLAAACAEAGNVQDAVTTVEKAAALAWKSGNLADRDQVPGMRERMRSYVAAVPYRDRTGGHNLPVYGYGFMLFAGFLIAGWAATRRAALVNVSGDTIWDLAMWLFAAGIFGGRLYYCIQYADRVFYNQVGNQQKVLKPFPDLIRAAVNLPDGGLVLYGGLLMGAVAYFTFCWKRKQNPLLLADITIPSVFIGVAFGRIGCFLNGCCYGDRCELPWAISFPLGSVPDTALVSRGFIGPEQPFSLFLHPTQLYSSLDAFILAALTHAYFRYRPRNGAVLALGLLTYPVTRFAIELLRGDELGQFHTPLTTAQFVSIALFATGLIYAVWLSRKPVAA
ncbi:MAG: prolipoprotein diacylglyceryl transferase family protein [Planctomycetaceae bacterium]